MTKISAEQKRPNSIDAELQDLMAMEETEHRRMLLRSHYARHANYYSEQQKIEEAQEAKELENGTVTVRYPRN